jgi:biotin carboxyl carrier protein
MKLLANIDGETVEIEIDRSGETLSARIGDRLYDLEVTDLEPGVFAIRDGAKLRQAVVTAGSPTRVTIQNHEFEVEITDPKRLRGTGIGTEHGAGTAEIKTMMPGKVVRILVEVGAPVQKGDGVIVVEAMKMQNEMKSQKDGVVKELRSAEGSTVNAGDVLVVIE